MKGKHIKELLGLVISLTIIIVGMILAAGSVALDYAPIKGVNPNTLWIAGFIIAGIGVLIFVIDEYFHRGKNQSEEGNYG